MAHPHYVYMAIHHYATLEEVASFLRDDIFDPAYCPLTPRLPWRREAWYFEAHDDLLVLVMLGNDHARRVLMSLPDANVVYIARALGARAARAAAVGFRVLFLEVVPGLRMVSAEMIRRRFPRSVRKGLLG